MGAGHHQALTVAYQKAVKGFREGDAVKTLSFYGLGLGVVPADDVPHHYQVGTRLQVRRMVTVLQGDAQALQKRAHGRINMLVGACNLVAHFLQDARQGSHASAADTQ